MPEYQEYYRKIKTTRKQIEALEKRLKYYLKKIKQQRKEHNIFQNILYKKKKKLVRGKSKKTM